MRAAMMKYCRKQSTMGFKRHLRPIYWLARLFGLVHCNLYPENSGKVAKIVLERFSSVPYFLYHVILILIEFNHFRRGEKRSLTHFLPAFTCFLKITIDSLWFFSKRHEMSQLVNETETICAKLTINFKTKRVKYEVAAIVATITTLWLTVFAMNVIHGYRRVLTWINEIIIFVSLTNYFISAVTGVIQTLFRSINEKIKSATPQNAVIIFRDCTETHLMLGNLARRLNSLFSVPLLGNTLFFFVLYVTLTYRFVSSFIKLEKVDLYQITIFFIAFVLITFQLIFMIRSWDAIPKQAHKTGLLVHKYCNKHNESKNEEIDTISLHLLQNKIKFTVCGFVDLDWSLLHLVIQTTTMYLVWVLQLKSQ